MRRLVSLICALALVAGASARAQQQKDPPTLEIGRAAPDFELPGVDGKTYTLASFAGARILVIIFTANHCPTAIAYEDRIIRLAADYKDKGVAVVAISTNDPKALRLDEMGHTDMGDTLEEMKIRAKHKKFNFPYLYDGDKQEVGHAYGPRATPHVFIFDAERKLRYVGRIDNAERESAVKTRDARNAIEALLEGRPVPVETTRPFGCSMKWSYKRDSVVQAMKRLAAEPVSVEPIDTEGLKALRKNDSGKLRLINLWATWCGPCVTEFPELVTMNRMYRRRNFELVTVSADDPEEKESVIAFLKKREASNKNYYFNSSDRDQLVEGIGKEFEGAIPYTLLVRPGGEVVYRHTGAIDPLEVRRIIVKELGPRGR